MQIIYNDGGNLLLLYPMLVMTINYAYYINYKIKCLNQKSKMKAWLRFLTTSKRSTM